MKIGPAGDRQQSHTLRMHKKCTAQQREHNYRHARAHPMHENGTAQGRERSSRDARAHPMHKKGTTQQRERTFAQTRARRRATAEWRCARAELGMQTRVLWSGHRPCATLPRLAPSARVHDRTWHLLRRRILGLASGNASVAFRSGLQRRR